MLFVTSFKTARKQAHVCVYEWFYVCAGACILVCMKVEKPEVDIR